MNEEQEFMWRKFNDLGGETRIVQRLIQEFKDQELQYISVKRQKVHHFTRRGNFTVEQGGGFIIDQLNENQMLVYLSLPV